MKYILMILLLFIMLFVYWRYRTNKEWEELLYQKQQTFTLTPSLRKRTLVQYRQVLGVCGACFLAVTLLPSSFLMKKSAPRSAEDNMPAPMTIYEESAEQKNDATAQNSLDKSASEENGNLMGGCLRCDEFASLWELYNDETANEYVKNYYVGGVTDIALTQQLDSFLFVDEEIEIKVEIYETEKKLYAYNAYNNRIYELLKR